MTSSPPVVLSVRRLGKSYRRYRHEGLRVLSWFGLRAAPTQTTPVLHDISFELRAGETLGLIGQNGAGKSTLLKIIAGTLQPTSGTVESQGRIAAILELGMGFNPEFTGRQNAAYALGLMGFSPDRIATLLPAVEAFAEIGDYFDQPMRIYSSGMHMRVAFAVVTAERPQVLIVDEALSVGDAYFQHKSFDRIRQFRDAGTTLLLVSHSPAVIKTLCDRALLLEHGSIIRDGDPDAVLDYYNAVIARRQADYEIRQTEQTRGQRVTRSGCQSAVIESVELEVGGQPVRAVLSGAPASIAVDLRTQADLDEVTVGILIRDRLGNDVFGTNTFHHACSPAALPAGARARVVFDFPSMGLGVGTYSLSVALHRGDAHLCGTFDWWDRALVFQVLPDDSAYSIGVCNLPVTLRSSTSCSATESV